MKRMVLWGLVATAAVIALFFEAGRTLLFGWIGFLIRVVGRLHPDPATVIATCAAIVIFTAGVHWIGWTWAKRLPETRRWPLRASLAVTAVLFLLFAAGTAMVGAIHMTAWIATAPEPLRVQMVLAGVRNRSVQMNLKQVGLAFHNFQAAEDRLPPAGTFSPDGQMLHGWEIEVLPYHGLFALRLNKSLPWNHPVNAKYFRSDIIVFINPTLVDAPVRDADGFGLNHYAANSHLLRAHRSPSLADVGDGTAHTILLGEVNANFSPWGRPMNVRDPARGINRGPHGFGGAPGAGGAYFSMADGSVRFVSEKVSPAVLKALATPNGGEEIGREVLQER